MSNTRCIFAGHVSRNTIRQIIHDGIQLADDKVSGLCSFHCYELQSGNRRSSRNGTSVPTIQNGKHAQRSDVAGFSRLAGGRIVL